MKVLYGKHVSFGHLLIAFFQIIVAFFIRYVFQEDTITVALLCGSIVSIWLSIYTATHDLKIRTRW